jgi:phosphohistidine phosphatase
MEEAMALYLVQHALSRPKTEDPEKGISPTGRADTERIAAVAAGYGVHVSGILHSGLKRAAETAGIFADALHPPEGVGVVDGIAPLDDPAPVADTLDPEGNVMLVGHLPFMERLAGLLVTGSLDTPVYRFQNSGIVCLNRHPDQGNWVVFWSLSPRIG